MSPASAFVKYIIATECRARDQRSVAPQDQRLGLDIGWAVGISPNSPSTPADTQLQQLFVRAATASVTGYLLQESDSERLSQTTEGNHEHFHPSTSIGEIIGNY